MNAHEFWPTVAARLARNEPVFIALVAAATSGSPGTTGARLLLAADGSVQGTIGGGIMEVNLLKQARKRLEAGPDEPQVQRLVHRKTGTAEASGLICDGEQHNLTAVLEPARDAAAVEQFCQSLRTPGECATLFIDAAGLHCAAAGPHAAGGMRLTQPDAADWQYAEESLNRRRIAVIGGGHCGKALAQLATGIGYRADVFDTRPAVMEHYDWPADAGSHVLASLRELPDYLPYPALTRAVVMTTAVPYDIEALAAIADLDLRWLGVMGSRTKIDYIHESLRKRNVDAAAIAAIHGPIGLQMKSDTPAEIAVSIMGQLLAEEKQAAAAA